jgi:hypothetical protein
VRGAGGGSAGRFRSEAPTTCPPNDSPGWTKQHTKPNQNLCHPGIGSTSSKAGATSIGHEASDSSARSNATTTKGASNSASSTLAFGVFSTSDAGALAQSALGNVYANAASTSTGAASAAAGANSTARAHAGRTRSSSSSSSSAGTAKKGLFGLRILPSLPSLPHLPSIGSALGGNRASGGAAEPNALRIMGGSLAQSAGLKALLPAVPRIVPGFATDAPPMEAAVAPGNDTAAPPICGSESAVNATTCTQPTCGTPEADHYFNCTPPNANGTTDAAVMNTLNNVFGSLMDDHEAFMKRNSPPPPPFSADNETDSSSTSPKAKPASPPAPPAKKTATVAVPARIAPGLPLGAAVPAGGTVRAASLGAGPPGGYARPLVRKPIPKPVPYNR